MPRRRFAAKWPSAARCSITSRNSLRESASAPSAERSLLRPHDGFLRKILRKTLAPSVSLVTRIWCACRCGQLAANLRINRRFVHNAVAVHSPPTAPADIPQSTHNPTHLARWADTGLSPMCTRPNTVAHISPKFLLRRSQLGTHRFSRRKTALRRSMSPRSISFQVEPESSTVVHRQPLRSSARIGETRGETRGNRWLDLIVVWIEGTLWTWRQQPLVSPI